MGQRTQMVLKTKGINGDVQNKVYHLQWGFGKSMPMVVLNLLTDMNYGKGNKIYDYVRYKNTEKTVHDYTLKVPFEVTDEYEETLLHYDFDITKEDEIRMFEGDNNNGMCAIEIKEIQDKDYIDLDVSIAYIYGEEDVNCNTKKYHKVITGAKYMKQWKDYCSRDFIKTYTTLMKLFGVNEIETGV